MDIIYSFPSHPRVEADKADLIAKHLLAPGAALSYSRDFKCFMIIIIIIIISISFVLSFTERKTNRHD